ncbi:MAG TPA: hypothetical protein PKU94_06375 [Candidatus Hydrothermia bacterium]|nr:hypothetical protein [Candidatus Hydrothermia bacterium]
MTIMIGCPVQNRAHTLPDYLHHIYSLDYPKQELHLSFLVNGPQLDSTTDIILEYIDEYGDEYAHVSYGKLYSSYTDSRTGKRDYDYIAKIRNIWLTFARDTDTHIFSVDSDILIPRHTLNQLLIYDDAIISCLVKNHHNIPVYNIMIKDNNRYKHIQPDGGVMEVDVTGAAYLTPKGAIDSGVRYGYHEQGEDVYFCEEAKRRGYRILSDTSIEAVHLLG